MEQRALAMALFRDPRGSGEASLELRRGTHVVSVRIRYGRSADLLRRIELRSLSVSLHPALWLKGCGAVRDCACRKIRAGLQRDGLSLDLGEDIIAPWCPTGRWDTASGKDLVTVRLALASGAGIHLAQLSRALHECLHRLGPAADPGEVAALEGLGEAFGLNTLVAIETEGEVLAAARALP
jgi:hypothetical protein